MFYCKFNILLHVLISRSTNALRSMRNWTCGMWTKPAPSWCLCEGLETGDCQLVRDYIPFYFCMTFLGAFFFLKGQSIVLEFNSSIVAKRYTISLIIYMRTQMLCDLKWVNVYRLYFCHSKHCISNLSVSYNVKFHVSNFGDKFCFINFL